MNERTFRELVRQLRVTQKRYFKLRRPADLIDAKELERQIDVELAVVKPTLFEEDRGRQA